MAKQSTSARKSSAAKSPRETATQQATQRPGSPAAEQFERSPQPTREPQMVQGDSTSAGTNRNPGYIAESAIAERAYEIWKNQGGSDLDNWLRAERELREQNSAHM